MANKAIFKAAQRKDDPRLTDNAAGGVAFRMDDKAALAQYVMTGTFNNTFYSDARADLDRVSALASKVDDLFLAKLAVFGRKFGYMKDAPALMLAILSTRNAELFKTAFPQVIDNGKMVRTFVQFVRSGAAGRRSLGNAPKRQVAMWLENAPARNVLNAVGNDPSIADVIRLSRPKAPDAERAALFGYLIGKVDRTDVRLPQIVKDVERFRAGESDEVPNVDFRLLDGAGVLRAEHWKSIARTAPWHMTRMNLNTFARNGVFEDTELVQIVADRLRSREEIAKSKVFPYQLLAAYLNISVDVPQAIAEALIDAAEAAVENVPAIEGRVVLMPDVSGSMGSPVTGRRAGASSKVRCIDVAGLLTAAILRRNPQAEVIPFEQDVVRSLRMSARDSILTNAQKLASVGGGGTNCSAPLALLNKQKQEADMLIYVSDYESWMDRDRAGYWNGERVTATQREWNLFRKRCPQAKLACIDITPNGTVQAVDKAVLNVGGFSDMVFTLLADFAQGGADGFALVDSIESLTL